jgi:hypothetical protein
MTQMTVFITVSGNFISWAINCEDIFEKVDMVYLRRGLRFCWPGQKKKRCLCDTEMLMGQILL